MSPDGPVPMDQVFRDRLDVAANRFAAQGKRVLGLAYAPLQASYYSRARTTTQLSPMQWKMSSRGRLRCSRTGTEHQKPTAATGPITATTALEGKARVMVATEAVDMPHPAPHVQCEARSRPTRRIKVPRQ